MTEKLGKLLRLMLGSDQPGEIVAAGRAVVRALHAAGKDIHQLVDAAERGLQEPPDLIIDDKQRRTWRQRREWCARHAEHLTERELDFITSLARWHGYPTERQAAWLESIEQKIRSRSGAT
jgi:hypothetical protein